MMNNEKKFYVPMKGLVLYGDSFLIIHRTQKARGDHYYWELPGGRMEFGETPEETLLREIQEEIGLCVEPLDLLCVWHHIKDENTQLVGATYVCKAKSNQVILSWEHDDFAWVHVEDISKYNVHPAILEQMKNWDWEEIFQIINDS